MSNHVKTLRKRLERMERAQASHSGRPVNQRDSALADALRAAIRIMETPRIELPGGKIEAVLPGEEFPAHLIQPMFLGDNTAGQRHFIGGDEITPLANGGYLRHEGMLRDGEVAARLSEPGGIVQDNVSLGILKPLDRDEYTDRDYIPFGEGWEVHTKGKGSTFRLVWANPDNPDDYEPYAVCDERLHEPLTKMARDVRNAIVRIEARAGMIVQSHRTPNELSIGEDFVRYYEAFLWRENIDRHNKDEVTDKTKARAMTTALRDFIRDGKISIVLQPPTEEVVLGDFKRVPANDLQSATYRELRTVEEVQAAYDNNEHVEWADAWAYNWTHEPEHQNDPAMWAAWMKGRHIARTLVQPPAERNPAEVLREAVAEIGKEAGVEVDHASFDAVRDDLEEVVPLTPHQQTIIRAWQDGEVIERRHVSSTQWFRVYPFGGFEWIGYEYRVAP